MDSDTSLLFIDRPLEQRDTNLLTYLLSPNIYGDEKVQNLAQIFRHSPPLCRIYKRSKMWNLKQTR